MSFKSIDEGVLFFENVLTSTKTLINSGLWKEVDLRGLHDWVGYFESDSEKFLCGMILDALIFRSKAQTRALIANVLEKSIPQSLDYVSYEISQNFSKIVKSRYPGDWLHRIRIVPVIRDIDPPTKSGPLVARLYKKEAQVNDRFMDWPWSLSRNREKPEIVIFIDDFIGTGDQFTEFLDRFFKDNPKEDDISYIYAPLAACSKGIDRLREEHAYINVCYAEVVPEKSGFFSGMHARYQGIADHLITEIVETHDEFLKKVGLSKLREKRGYGDLELTYTYAHGTPNATLPILWAENEIYRPLFSR